MDKSSDKPIDKPNEKLERYLDQVCRGIAGPRALRQHVRQELREHLKDAIADHVAAGLTEEQAVDRALEDFGGPEVVRAELEATHGHRVMGVIIDKAMQWKERTVKAKWFWSAWAHLALGLVIAGETAFITMLVIFVVPKFEWFAKYGLLGPAFEDFRPWFQGVLDVLRFVALDWMWIIPTVIVLWGLFEWCVRSERKPFIRLASLGTLAVALLGMVMVTTTVLIAPLTAGVAYVHRRSPEKEVRTTMAELDFATAALEKAIREKDDDQIVFETRVVAGSVDDLASFSGASMPGLLALREPAAMEALRDRLHALRDSALNVRSAVQDHNGEGLDAAAATFRAAYEPLKLPPATRPAQ